MALKDKVIKLEELLIPISDRLTCYDWAPGERLEYFMKPTPALIDKYNRTDWSIKNHSMRKLEDYY